MADRDAVTVLTAVGGKPCNKIVTRLGSEAPSKQKAREGGAFDAEHVPVPDLEALADVLRRVGRRPDQMISLGLFKDAPARFAVRSMRDLAQILRCDPQDRATISGWHDVNGVRTIARMKENLLHGTVILLDRDMAPGQPPAFACWSLEEWCHAVGLLLPGFEQAGKIVVPSTSNRVLVDGRPLGGASCHAFVRVVDPDLIDAKWDQAAARALITRCAPNPWDDDELLAFGKPITDRATGATIYHQWWPIYDKSVSGRERLVFEGAPHIEGPGLELLPPDVRVFDGPRLDLSRVHNLSKTELKLIDAEKTRIRGKPTSTTLRKVADGAGRTQVGGVEETVADLVFDLVVTTPGGPSTIKQLHDAKTQHARLQSPYRESTSWAAFYGVHRDGSPFVFDMGDGVKHVLHTEDLARCWAIIRDWVQVHYDFQYKIKDGSFYSSTYGVTRITSILPNPEIIEQLVFASDAPRLADGTVSWGQLPKAFATWIKVACGALAGELPYEDEIDAVCETSREDWGVQLTSLLSTMATINPGSGEQRHPIASWALRFAQLHPGHWRQVRALPIWGRTSERGFQIALRPALAASLNTCPEIKNMSPTKFTRKCKSHCLCAEDNRITVEGRVIRATILSVEFVSDLDVSVARNDDSAEALHEKFEFPWMAPSP